MDINIQPVCQSCFSRRFKIKRDGFLRCLGCDSLVYETQHCYNGPEPRRSFTGWAALAVGIVLGVIAICLFGSKL